MAGRKYLNLLRADVQGRRIGRNGRLPTLREMAHHYDCSVSSIRQAVAALRSEGLLSSHIGKGIFCDSEPEAAPPRRRIIGAVVLRYNHYGLIEASKVEWQRRGWFITAYDAWSDFQDPELERNFLEQACREEFAGVVIAATPVEPLNKEFYREMRRRGLKVAHLSHYCPDMHDESFFLADYAAAGRLAAAASLQRGRKHLVMLLNHVTSPFMQEMRQGVREVVEGLGLPELEPICCDDWGSFLPADKAQKMHFLEEKLADFRALPRGTAILCCGAEMAHCCRALLEERGIQADKRFLILSLNSGSLYGEEEDGAIFDFNAQLQAALNYVTDESVSAETVVQQYFPPLIRVSRDPGVPSS